MEHIALKCWTWQELFEEDVITIPQLLLMNASSNLNITEKYRMWSQRHQSAQQYVINLSTPLERAPLPLDKSWLVSKGIDQKYKNKNTVTVSKYLCWKIQAKIP